MKTENFSLYDYPVLTCWPQDAGPFITLPMVFSRNPISGKRNCGMYRLQVFDERTTGMHWQTHKQGAEHYRRLAAEGRETRMDVAVAIGADPATVFSAILPLPPDLDEMLFAGFMRNKPVEMVKCKTVDLEVPANAEIVLEGRVTLGELRTEGPFGDHTGYYSPADEYPVFHVECITQRKNPIYATTIVGKPPMEDYYMGKTIERVFLPLLRLQLPEIVDMAMPPEGVFHNLMLVSIRKSYPGHARKVMSAIWGLGQAMFTKCIVVVDHDVNVQNYSETAFRALNNIDPERDLQFTLGPIDSLDHFEPACGLRLEGRYRRYEKVAAGRVSAALARSDRDGRGRQGAGRSDLGAIGDRKSGLRQAVGRGHCKSDGGRLGACRAVRSVSPRAETVRSPARGNAAGGADAASRALGCPRNDRYPHPASRQGA